MFPFRSPWFGLLVLPLATLGLGLLLSRCFGGGFLFLPVIAVGAWGWGRKSDPNDPRA